MAPTDTPAANPITPPHKEVTEQLEKILKQQQELVTAATEAVKGYEGNPLVQAMLAKLNLTVA